MSSGRVPLVNALINTKLVVTLQGQSRLLEKDQKSLTPVSVVVCMHCQTDQRDTFVKKFPFVR